MTTKEECKDEDEVLGQSSQWKDINVDTIISLQRETKTKNCEEWQ